MPHIIVEYSKKLEPKIGALLYDMHEKLAALGVEKSRIKTRGIAVDHAVVGEDGAAGNMIHATLLLLEGRDIPTKKTYGDALHKLMQDAAHPYPCAVTLEIRDMVKDTYYL